MAKSYFHGISLFLSNQQLGNIESLEAGSSLFRERGPELRRSIFCFLTDLITSRTLVHSVHNLSSQARSGYETMTYRSAQFQPERLHYLYNEAWCNTFAWGSTSTFTDRGKGLRVIKQRFPFRNSSYRISVSKFRIESLILSNRKYQFVET